MVIKGCLFIIAAFLIYSKPMTACANVKGCKKKKYRFYRSFKKLKRGKKTISRLQNMLGDSSDNPDRVIKLVHNITIIQNEIELRTLKCRRLKQELHQQCSSCINVSELPSSQ